MSKKEFFIGVVKVDLTLMVTAAEIGEDGKLEWDADPCGLPKAFDKEELADSVAESIEEEGYQTFVLKSKKLHIKKTPIPQPNLGESRTNTEISYLYRDSANYKVWQSAIVSGMLSHAQKKKILAALYEGEFFIPSQVGLPEERFAKITDEDHCWFEMDEDFCEYTASGPTVCLTAQDLTKAFEKAGADGWEAHCGPYVNDSRYSVHLEGYVGINFDIKAENEDSAMDIAQRLFEEGQFADGQCSITPSGYSNIERITKLEEYFEKLP